MGETSFSVDSGKCIADASPARPLSVAEPPSSAVHDYPAVVTLVAFDASCPESLPSWQRRVTATSAEKFFRNRR
jgi:hypothetical protein